MTDMLICCAFAVVGMLAQLMVGAVPTIVMSV
jgi:hypothetical protein